MEDLMETDESQENQNSLENVIGLFSSLNVQKAEDALMQGTKFSNLNSVEEANELSSTLNIQKFHPLQDFLIESELKNANLFEDDAIKYATILINSSLSSQQLAGALILRRLTCKAEIPYQKVIQSNILPSLIQLIPYSDEQFIYEVSYIILNIAGGDKSCNDYLLSQNSWIY
ncbi:unnamed protein product [Blepharisma stoltei]|uniref:Armadillo repeat-containing protein 7 n=1 Tax=Blepharisma stoltei TaxID=1481888 RepID=A0AAU9KB63_9CILI|nr:unnamed protein product [Blepharisma stoltei]